MVGVFSDCTHDQYQGIENDQSQPGLSLVTSEVFLLSATAFVFLFLFNSEAIWSFLAALLGELVWMLFWSEILLGLTVQGFSSVCRPTVWQSSHLLVPYAMLR